MRPIKVLSLFDGMSCGQIALRDLGIPIEVYYASEIDKFAIQQTQLNFPDTVQLGDVRNIDVDKLCENGEIDLLIGGSPCTNLSFAGKRAGLATKENIEILTLDQYLDLKDADFEFEGQSYLFWEFMRILTALRRRNPNIMFLLENVEMGKKWESVLSDAIGIRGVHINSALVSAQNRKRIYWSNIRVREEGLFGYRYTDIPQPTDRGILLRDILEKDVDERYFMSDNLIVSNNHLQKNLTDVDSKANAFLATSHKGAWANGMTIIRVDGNKSSSQPNRVYSDVGKSPNIGNAHFSNTINIANGYRIRRITPTECARLQTIPDWYKWKCSETQQYRMLGNGWTVEVIKHIFSFMRLEDTV